MKAAWPKYKWFQEILCMFTRLQRLFDFILLFTEHFEQRSKLDCPVDCETYNHEYQLSSALFLPDKLLPMKKNSYLKNAKNLPNDTEAMAQFML